MKEKKFKQKRKKWYNFMKFLMKSRYKKPTFLFLGEKPKDNSIILSNHEGTDAPMSLEIYCDFPIRFWGASEMNSGLISMYKYQSRVYYHEKKHWNLHLARLFCLIASPLTNLFYKGLNLISTYHDSRLRATLNQSIDAIVNKKENIVIFPEKSDEGYTSEMKGFYAGFLILAQKLYQQNVDVNIYVSYFKKSNLTYVFAKPIKYSELVSKFSTREEITSYLVDECNKLGKIELEKDSE